HSPVDCPTRYLNVEVLRFSIDARVAKGIHKNPSLGGYDAQAQVDGGGRMGERAHADVVDAGLGIEPHVLDIDAARSLEGDASRVAAHALHAGAHQVG